MNNKTHNSIVKLFLPDGPGEYEFNIKPTARPVDVIFSQDGLTLIVEEPYGDIDRIKRKFMVIGDEENKYEAGKYSYIGTAATCESPEIFSVFEVIG